MPITFTAPGGLTDMNEAAAAAWDETINRYMNQSKLPPATTFAGSRSQFFNPATGIAEDAVTAEIGWDAFPLPISNASTSDEERWEIGDESRGGQVEYCEWSVDSRADGSIRRITFTCEDREYFRNLAKHQPDTVLQLYRDHVSPEVQPGDIFGPGEVYQPINKWNNNVQTGAMHMIASPNTIGAAIELAAGATVVRLRRDGNVMTGAQELIRCGGYGVANRHSDPTIGERVNSLARNGHTISLANPPELSFESISFTGWSLPRDASPEDVWRFTRGIDAHYVRGVLEVPEALGFGVGDIEIDGQPIRFGGQVADKIRIKIIGLAHRLGQANVAPLNGCINDPVSIAQGMGPGAGAQSEASAAPRNTEPLLTRM